MPYCKYTVKLFIERVTVLNIVHKNFFNKIFVLVIHLKYSKNIYIMLFS